MESSKIKVSPNLRDGLEEDWQEITSEEQLID